ncbi:MAG: hypothetical protein NTV79_09615 [Candidatus Aureabacteria bacterium]|nr:hypothetical protein [Candidatus Auribacterota bacterium]
MNENHASPSRQRVRVKISSRSRFPWERRRIGGKIWIGAIGLSALAGAALGWQIGRAVIRAIDIKKKNETVAAPWTRPSEARPGGADSAAHFAGETAPPPPAAAVSTPVPSPS